MQDAHTDAPAAPTVIWTPQERATRPLFAGLKMTTAMRRGASGHCPACGKGRLFRGWLGVVDECAVCAAPLGQIRADDAPPYFTVFIVAHVVIGLQIALESRVMLSVGTEMMIFVPGTLLLVVALIRPVKGATVGMMMKLGFMKPQDEAPEHRGDA
jgi:uncharacterized protein (DUF983 family)